MILGDIGMAIGDQLVAKHAHFGNVVRRARLHRRRKNAERGNVLVELRRRVLGETADGLGRRHVGKALDGARVDLVVDVRDVARIGDVTLAVYVAEQAKEHVENDDGTRIADVREVVDRRPANVHAHVRRIDRLERLLAPRQCIVERERHATP